VEHRTLSPEMHRKEMGYGDADYIQTVQGPLARLREHSNGSHKSM
jgi:hypothetical protein